MKEPRPERDGAEDECENQDKTFNTFRRPPPSSPLRTAHLPHLAPPQRLAACPALLSLPAFGR